MWCSLRFPTASVLFYSLLSVLTLNEVCGSKFPGLRPLLDGLLELAKLRKSFLLIAAVVLRLSMLSYKCKEHFHIQQRVLKCGRVWVLLSICLIKIILFATHDKQFRFICQVIQMFSWLSWYHRVNSCNNCWKINVKFYSRYSKVSFNSISFFDSWVQMNNKHTFSRA